MAATDLGRVQGGGFFGSTSERETEIPAESVGGAGGCPLIGDTIVNFNGALCRIDEITTDHYIVTKYGSIKGDKGDKGDKGEQGESIDAQGTYPNMTVGKATNADTLDGKHASEFATAAQGVKADTAYQKPSTGIPKTDLASAVQASLTKADHAAQVTLNNVYVHNISLVDSRSSGNSDYIYFTIINNDKAPLTSLSNIIKYLRTYYHVNTPNRLYATGVLWHSSTSYENVFAVCADDTYMRILSKGGHTSLSGAIVEELSDVVFNIAAI